MNNYPDDEFYPEQCRSGRAAKGLSQEDLARAAGVTKKTVADFERGATNPQARTKRDIRQALEAVGIEFIPPGGQSLAGGPGLRIRVEAASE